MTFLILYVYPFCIAFFLYYSALWLQMCLSNKFLYCSCLVRMLYVNGNACYCAVFQQQCIMLLIAVNGSVTLPASGAKSRQRPVFALNCNFSSSK